MSKLYEGESINKVWLIAAKELKEKSLIKKEILESRNGRMVEISHAIFDVNNSHERFLLCRKPNISIAIALSEIICILKGSRDAKILNYWNPELMKYAGNSLKYHGAYGYRLRSFFFIDQIKRVYFVLKHNPNTRQAVMLIWDPINDLPNKDGSSKNKDIPCNIVSLIKIRNNKLIWSQIMRSNDIYLGTPYNFIQFTFLQEILSGWLGIEIGPYTLFCDSLHYYETNFDLALYSQAETNVNRIINTDYFTDSYNETHENVNYIYSIMKRISRNRFTEKEAKKVLINCKLEQRWKNILFILIAYYAHRNNNVSLQEKFIAEVRNPVYLYLWKKHFKQ